MPNKDGTGRFVSGGLDVYSRLLKHLPIDMGVAIVIVNHLRIVPSQLHEILPYYTEMPVKLITENLLIEPNHVFIIPAQPDMPESTIESGCIDFVLSPEENARKIVQISHTQKLEMGSDHE